MQTEVLSNDAKRKEALDLSWNLVLARLKHPTLNEKEKFSIAFKLALKDAGRAQIDPSGNPFAQIGNLIGQLDGEGLRMLVAFSRSRNVQAGTSRVGEVRQTDDKPESGRNNPIHPEQGTDVNDKQGTEVP